MNAELEAEFRALEVVLSHSAGGELRWPDAEQDVDDCARAAAKLGWLGNDGAAEPPPPVGALDSFLIGYAGWLAPDTADIAAHQLAATIVGAETEFRAAEWASLATVLSHVVDGRLVWPDDAAERAAVFEAVMRLGWPPTAPVVGVPPAQAFPTSAGGTYENPPRKDPTVTTPTPRTWGETKAAFATAAALKAAHPTWGALKAAGAGDPVDRKDPSNA